MIPRRLVRCRWRLARLVLAAVVSASCGLAAAEPFKVMSFNILADFLEGPDDQWLDPVHPRRDRVGAVLVQENPDLLALQEVTLSQMSDLTSFLPDYDFVSGPLSTGSLSNVILYKPSRFQLQAAGAYQTPSDLGRPTQWARLRDLATDQSLVVFGVHLNPFESSIRLAQAQELQTAMPAIAGDLPKILLGDFNFVSYQTQVETTPTITFTQTLTPHYLEITGRSGTQAAFLVDAGVPLYGGENSFSNRRIDYITHSDDFEVIDGQVVTTLIDGLRPSDHRPLTAVLSLTQEGAQRTRWPVQSHIVSDVNFGAFDGSAEFLQQSSGSPEWPIGLDGDFDNKLIMKFTVPKADGSGPAIESAVLRLYVADVLGTVPGGLSLLHRVDDNDFQAALADYQAPYLDTGLDLLVSAAGIGRYHELDVTALVLADAMTDSGAIALSAFRLEIGGGHQLDALEQHAYLINTQRFAPQLVITFVPEPAAAWAFAWGLAALALARRARAAQVSAGFGHLKRRSAGGARAACGTGCSS